MAQTRTNEVIKVVSNDIDIRFEKRNSHHSHKSRVKENENTNKRKRKGEWKNERREQSRSKLWETAVPFDPNMTLISQTLWNRRIFCLRFFVILGRKEEGARRRRNQDGRNANAPERPNEFIGNPNPRFQFWAETWHWAVNTPKTCIHVLGPPNPTHKNTNSPRIN